MSLATESDRKVYQELLAESKRKRIALEAELEETDARIKFLTEKLSKVNKFLGGIKIWKTKVRAVDEYEEYLRECAKIIHEDGLVSQKIIEAAHKQILEKLLSERAKKLKYSWRGIDDYTKDVTLGDSSVISAANLTLILEYKKGFDIRMDVGSLEEKFITGGDGRSADSDSD